VSIYSKIQTPLLSSWLKTKGFITIGIMYTNQLPFCLLHHEVSSYDVCHTLKLNILQDTHNWIIKKMFLCIAWYNINIYAIKQQVKIPFQWTFNNLMSFFNQSYYQIKSQLNLQHFAIRASPRCSTSWACLTHFVATYDNAPGSHPLLKS